jgi:hypothetical protein
MAIWTNGYFHVAKADDGRLFFWRIGDKGDVFFYSQDFPWFCTNPATFFE